MAQIINEYRGLGNVLGEGLGQGVAGLGQGIGGALQNLANMKLNQFAQRQQAAQAAKTYGKIPGATPELAEFLAGLSPEERKPALQNLEILLKLFGGNDQGTSQGALQEPNATGMGSLQSLSAADLLSNPNQVNPLIRQALSQAPLQLENQESSPSQQQAAQVPQGLEEKSKLASQLFTSPHEKREQEKLGLQKEEHERKGSKDVREYLAPYYKQVQASEDNIRDYKLLEKLARSGDLRSGRTYQLLSKLGLEDFGLNYTSQLANKLIGRLAQNAQSAFGPGTRVTNYLERVFQRSLPSLWNTPEGIIGISKLNSLADQVNQEEFELRRRIIKENKGKVPGDIDGEVRERMTPIRERLESQALDIVTGLDVSKRGDELRPKGYKGRVLDTTTGKIIQV